MFVLNFLKALVPTQTSSVSKYEREVIVSLTFAGIHHWPGAVHFEGKEYLADPHRHLFHVKAWAPVRHDDRDIEILDLKEQLQDWIKVKYRKAQHGSHELHASSCEDVARKLLDAFPRLSQVEVLEDGENGARFKRVLPDVCR